MSRITQLQDEVSDMRKMFNFLTKNFDDVVERRIEQLVAREFANKTPPQVETKKEGVKHGN